MIQANELRIGNWIAYGKEYNDTSAIGKVLSIGSTEQDFEQVYCECEESFEWFFKDNYSGIPLSPEILERCGFVADHVSHYGGWLIKVNNDEQIRIVWDENIGWHWPMNGHNKPIVNYLHQLQNLYYCLCGQELTFKQ